MVRRVFDDERVANAERLAVDLELAFTFAVLDPVVVTDREHLLPHPVVRWARVVVIVSTPSQQSHGPHGKTRT
jgi:hypothetical protein